VVAAMTDPTANGSLPDAPDSLGREASHLRELTGQQWRSGIAAWLGWMFDGLDMHLYTLVATPFVAELLQVGQKDRSVGFYSSWIQAAFLLGWAIGGGFFGRVGDRLGRARALMLTILTYALFTGLSFFAQTWWHLLACRFLAALGIGGEWAVGASLLSETWPRRWRPWIAAVLQSAVNVGVIFAMLAGYLLKSAPPRYVFLVGILPALLVVWIRRAVPEPDEWQRAKDRAVHREPRLLDLFGGPVRRTTILTVLVCAFSLTAHWAFMFWYLQHLRNLPDLAAWTEPQKTALASTVMILVMVASIVGNFFAAWFARRVGYRWSISLMYLAYFSMMVFTYAVPRGYVSLSVCVTVLSVASGLFGLFTMYLPPLFPTLLRTTGAGFCYNIGRIVAAAGTVLFGLFSAFSSPGDYRLALFSAAFLFVPPAFIVLMLPEPPAARDVD
jgi:MFS family permease